MKTLLILAACFPLASCVTITAPDGTKTTRADVDAINAGVSGAKILIDANSGK